MLKPGLTLIIFFTLSTALGQRVWKPGYFIKQKGDTIRAEILDTDRTDFTSMTYRSSSSQETKVLATEILGYGIDGARKWVVLPSTPLNNTEPRFYEILVSGKAKLYLMEERYLITTDDSAYYELKNAQREEFIKGKVFKRELYPFRGLLSFLLNDCPAVKKEILIAILSELNMVKLVNHYNDCFGGSKKLDNKVKGVFEFAMGLSAGYVFQSIRYNSEIGVPTYLRGTNPASSNFGARLFGEYAFSRKAWVNLGLLYYTTNLNFVTDEVNGTETKHNVMSYSGSNLNIDPSFGYSFRTTGLSPYVFAGPSLGFTFGENSSLTRTTTINIGSTPIVSNPTTTSLYTTNFSFGLNAGGGIKWKTESRFTPFFEARAFFLSGSLSGINQATNAERTGIAVTVGVKFH